MRRLAPHQMKLAMSAGTALLLISVMALLMTLGNTIAPVAARPSAPTVGNGNDRLPGRVLHVSAPTVTSTTDAQVDRVGVDVALTNTGGRSLTVRPSDFLLTAEGDIFGQLNAPTPTGALAGAIAPTATRLGHLTFMVPAAALPYVRLFYHSSADNVTSSVALNSSTLSSASGATAPLSSGINTIEDTFTRPNQTGWGTSTNSDSVPNVSWGIDGSGSLSNVTINNNTGQYGYPGNINQIGIASAGSATHSGGDTLVEFSMSAVGHVTPYVVQNACSDKSCYYGARMHTSQSRLEIAKRVGGNTTILASVAFTPSAKTLYWMRLDVSVGSGSDTIQAKIWADGSAEPGWMVSVTDTSPLGPNLVGTGGSWDQPGTGESMNYACYAFAASGLAAACGQSTPPTPTPTPSITPTPTNTPSSTGNTIEDTFTRPNQTGWGNSTNSDSVPNVSWGMDGNGSLSNVTISNNSGAYAYPGNTNQIGIASAGSTSYNGGDALVAFWVSAVGHVTPYVVLNACSDKSCYYGARVHTSQGLLELARRGANNTTVLATTPFTPSANTLYWMRLDVSVGSGSDTIQAKIWANGSSEPSAWMVTATDGSPLAANLAGAGGSWDQVGTGESINYACYAYAASGLAAPCAGTISTPPTPTPTPTSGPTSTPTTAPSPTPTPPPVPPNTLAIIHTKIWANGSPEPTNWIVNASTQAGPLGADPVGVGGSWDQVGTGESINYACFAYATSGQAAPCGSGATGNTIEDTFTRPNQTGWGTSTNSDGVPNVTWGMDGNGSLSNVTISNNTGQYGYPGAINVPVIASAGGTSYNGGDALAEFSVSAVGHATPYLTLNACPNKSCYYGARLHTSQSVLEVAQRWNGNTIVLASVPFTPTANTLYWMRLDVTFVSATINEYAITNGVQDPWATAFDSAGNVWFAEPGCDPSPTCPSGTPPGQIGELVASTHAVNLYTLPNLTGNQPLFVALDGSGNVWFTTPNNSMIGEFNPSTQKFVGQWSVTSGSGPWDLTFNKGMLWYTEHFVAAVGEFDPNAHTHTDFQTPSGNSFPYGIVANDPANGNLIWFTENSNAVARIGVLDTGNGNAISEYLIRAQLPSAQQGVNSGLTPHMITLDAQGNPWWTEGWIRDIGKLVPSQATPGKCGVSSGDCLGITEYALPNPAANCTASHVSAIAIQSSQMVWLDDSSASQIASFDPTSQQFTMYDLTNCGAHPHDGLHIDGSGNVWWDEEFANNLGELT